MRLNHMSIMRIFIFLFFLFVIFQDASMAGPAGFVWASKDANNLNIYLSRNYGDGWQTPMKLTKDRSTNITPAISIRKDAVIAVAWIRRRGKSNSIIGVEARGDAISPEFKIPSQFPLNYSPSIIFDEDERLWATWSSFDGKGEEIFASVRIDSVWSKPTQISRTTSTPNILPNIVLNEKGFPVVTWRGLSGKNYVNFSSEWNGKEWMPARKTSSVTKQAESADIHVPSIPEHAKNRLMGELSFVDKNGFGHFLRVNKHDFSRRSRRNDK